MDAPLTRKIHKRPLKGAQTAPTQQQEPKASPRNGSPPESLDAAATAAVLQQHTGSSSRPGAAAAAAAAAACAPLLLLRNKSKNLPRIRGPLLGNYDSLNKNKHLLHNRRNLPAIHHEKPQ